MVGKRKAPFDPKAFLAKAGIGRAISKYANRKIVFAQGQPADTVFYIQKGKVKLTVVSKQGKEAVVAVLSHDEFLDRDAWPGSIGIWRRPRR